MSARTAIIREVVQTRPTEASVAGQHVRESLVSRNISDVHHFSSSRLEFHIVWPPAACDNDFA